MNCIAAKIPEKVFVLFKDEHIDASASEKEAEHHPGGTAADNATTGVNCFHFASQMPDRVNRVAAGRSLTRNGD
jgi:hypothetical protein